MRGITATRVAGFILLEIENTCAHVTDGMGEQLILSRGALRRSGLLARLEELDATAMARRKKKNESETAVIKHIEKIG